MIEERHEATVVSTDDPEKRGRIRVSCSGILGDAESDLPMWVEPTLDWGFFAIPEVGEIVEIVVDASNTQDEMFEQTSIENLNPRWYGARFYQKTTDGAAPVPEIFTSKNYGKRRGLRTPAGHVLVFDDTSGQEEITLSASTPDPADSSGKTKKQAFVSMNSDGSIVLSNTKGSTIYLNAKDGQLSIIDQFGNTYASDEDGLKLVSKHGYFFEMKEGTVQLVAGANVVIQANNCSLKAASVDIVDGADSFMVRGTDLMTWLNSHTHNYNPGPGAPVPSLTPTVPAPGTILSTAAKVK